jgi:hypothetical protein
VGAFSGPDLSENGLVLALDAANPKNYNLTAVEVLVVAGGGGGGGYHGGGGGAGGLLYSSSHSITPGSAITATIGAGGGAPNSSNNTGSAGGNSVFGSLIAIGGGAGISQSNEAQARNNGGSGGGGCDGGSSVNHPGGSGTSGQGFKGGDVFGSGDQLAVNYGTAGGGGAGGVGGNGGVIGGGFGGPGLPFNISGNLAYYGGGGGGTHLGSAGITNYGIGGTGGGGTGGISPSPHNSAIRNSSSGVDGTGGGGGGHLYSNLGGGAGGSGIVIVRYPGPQKAIGGTVTSVGGDTIHTFTTSGTFTFTSLVATNNSAVLGLSDFSGRNNFGTAVNGPTYSSANGGSLSFDGSDKYVNVGSLGSQFTNFTVEIWFKSDSVTNYRNPIDCNFLIENGSYSNLGPRLEQNSSGNLGWLVGSGSNVYTGIDVVPSGLDVSKYHYTAITKSSSTLFTTYYNGNAVTTTNFSNWTGSMLNVNIGRGFSLDSERKFNGKIPSVKIYNRALTAAEVTQNFNATRSRYGI